MRDLVIASRDFVMAGGAVTLEEWLDLTKEQREMLKIAGREKEERMADDLIERLAATFSAVGDAMRLERLAEEAARVIERAAV